MRLLLTFSEVEERTDDKQRQVVHRLVLRPVEVMTRSTSTKNISKTSSSSSSIVTAKAALATRTRTVEDAPETGILAGTATVTSSTAAIEAATEAELTAAGQRHADGRGSTATEPGLWAGHTDPCWQNSGDA